MVPCPLPCRRPRAAPLRAPALPFPSPAAPSPHTPSILRQHGKHDKRPIVLVIGDWILKGRNPAVLKGRGTAIGSSLLRALDQRFVVVIINEAWTTQTCCWCRMSGVLTEENKYPLLKNWEEKERAEKKQRKELIELAKPHVLGCTERPYIRGLKRCDTCKTCVNRDLNGAINISLNFLALFYNQPQLVLKNRELSADDEYDETEAYARALMALYDDDDDERDARSPEDEGEQDDVSTSLPDLSRPRA